MSRVASKGARPSTTAAGVDDPVLRVWMIVLTLRPPRRNGFGIESESSSSDGDEMTRVNRVNLKLCPKPSNMDAKRVVEIRRAHPPHVGQDTLR